MKDNNHLEQLRSNMMGGDGQEEKVEVNQRHLIDKILARYSTEHVLYRELMQNADDASSTSVEIRFHSQQSAADSDTKRAPDLSVKCDKITFKNNGIPFRPEDWARLKRIAEGNPDEQKIGAFGVGFYSLFSVCENPFVFSGRQCMAFYFKGDQLFAKRADVAESDTDDWTSFLMDLREPMEMPDLEDFSKFLATSMGFTANLRQITVYLDQHMIFNIKKKMAEPYNIPVDNRKMYTATPQKMFTITGASMQQIQLDAEKYTPSSGIFQLATSLLSRREIDTSSGLPMEKASIFLRVVTGSLDVAVSREYEREMERATKKKPPKTTTYQLVYTGREELDASGKSTSSVFERLLPFPHQGRIFIGFATHQTTGCCSHMAARFIPTVERESIDFADRYISIWNKELLAVGGLLCRIVYDNEMTQIERLYRELVGDHDLVDKTKETEADGPKHMLEKRAAHALRSFTFQPSTPNAIVGRVQEQLFFQSSKIPARIMTSHGIQPVTSARVLDGQHMASNMVNPFVKTIPTIPDYIMTECKESMDKFKSFSLLRPLDLDDILKELDTRSLNETEMISCMKWWIDYSKATNYGHVHPRLERFLNAAILDCDGKRFLPLASFTSWINPKLIPLDMPAPETTIPFSVSKSFDPNLLQQFFGNWTELSLMEWIRFIASKPEIQTSAPFAEKVLSVLSRGFRHVSSKSQTEISAVLKNKQCMPTRYGMKVPAESYFPTVNLFDDLPIVHFENPRAVSDQVLTVLGVRKHVDLQLVFDRLISDGSWSHVDLVKYLTTVQGTLSSVELSRLRETAIFTKEGEQPKLKEVEKKVVDANGNSVTEKHQKKIYRRYKAKELFTPTEKLRELKLPLIDWNGRWRQTSDEAKFLETLGLHSYPPLSMLLTLASQATNDRQVQLRALQYFVENEKQYADAYDVSNLEIAFLPCSDGKTYAAPKDCFSNAQVQLLDFNVLHRDLIPIKDKLRVRENPEPDRLLDAFMTHITKDQKKSQQMFEYLANRMGEFRYNHWQLLRHTKFIPVASHREDEGIVLIEPTQCYFESNGSSFHKELFTYVNFGEKANMFLRSCGVKDEPTTTELATMIVKDPARFWNLSGGGERYLSVLRQIAGQFEQIRSDRYLSQEMKNSPFLVGIKRSRLTQQNSAESSSAAEESNVMDEFVQYQLAKASDIFIIDDTMSQQIFSPLSAPMEQLLEEFYSSLGSKKLSSQIKETYTYRDVMGVTERSRAITEAIFERTPIIIYQMLSDNPQRQRELYRDEKYVKNNLKVVQVRELKIKRQFKHTGEENVQPTTACGGRSNFTIYVSGTGEIDYYDVANALCSLIFIRVRFNDAIIVERYLTASLTSLKRKGVPVDRILNIRKDIESIPATPSPPVPQPTPTPTLTPAQLDSYTNKILDVFGDCEKGYIRQLLSQEKENHVENVINRLLQEGYPTQQGDVQDDNAQGKLKETQMSNEQKRGTRLLDRIWSWNRTRSPTLSGPPKPETESSPLPPPQTPQTPKLPPSEGTITPNYMSSIRQNLRRGIHSCKAYSGQDIYSPPQLNNVKESHSYCDATPQQNLVAAGQAMGMQLFVHRDVNPEDVRKQYGAAMSRFSNIISVLVQVFELKASSIHIFYDTSGGTVAFNRSGSIFLNLRYYLALHDTEDLSAYAAKRKEGLIYWFMTLCHELAHNFVAEHSSEHEFYMSSFAEVYLEALVPYLTPVPKE